MSVTGSGLWLLAAAGFGAMFGLCGWAAAEVAKAGFRRTSARLVLPILALALGCFMLVAVAAFQMFPLLGPATAGP
jgi:hypothetical protein